MANPTKFRYKIPTSNTDGSALVQSAIKSIEIGLGTTTGQYTTIKADTTFAPGADGFSEEPIATFGVLSPGTYFAAARTVSTANIMSAWSGEAQFVIEPPVPNPPSSFSVA